MSNIYSFCNQKGGVGKTTSAINLATLIAKKNKKVLLVDMDAQGNATSGLGIEKDDVEYTSYQLLVDNFDPRKIIQKTAIKRLDLIPANYDLSGADLDLVSQPRREYVLQEQLLKIEKDYDYIFIDCPPSLGLVTINCLVSSGYVMIPLQCEYYALEGLGQLLRTFGLVKENLREDLEIGGVVLTMADFRTNLTQQVIEEVRAHFKERVFQTVIPRSVRLSEAPSFGKPAVIYDAGNKASKAYIELAKEFIRRFENERQSVNRAGTEVPEAGPSGQTTPAEEMVADDEKPSSGPQQSQEKEERTP